MKKIHLVSLFVVSSLVGASAVSFAQGKAKGSKQSKDPRVVEASKKGVEYAKCTQKCIIETACNGSSWFDKITGPLTKVAELVVDPLVKFVEKETGIKLPPSKELVKAGRTMLDNGADEKSKCNAKRLLCMEACSHGTISAK